MKAGAEFDVGVVWSKTEALPASLAADPLLVKAEEEIALLILCMSAGPLCIKLSKAFCTLGLSKLMEVLVDGAVTACSKAGVGAANDALLLAAAFSFDDSVWSALRMSRILCCSCVCWALITFSSDPSLTGAVDATPASSFNS